MSVLSVSCLEFAGQSLIPSLKLDETLITSDFIRTPSVETKESAAVFLQDCKSPSSSIATGGFLLSLLGVLKDFVSV